MTSGTPFNFTVETTAVKILEENLNRKGLTMIAATGNTGTIYVSYNDPAVSATAGSSKLGVPLSAGRQAIEEPPVNTGALWVIATAASQILLVFETT